jgi:cyclase
MLSKKIIPCLDIKDRKVVKGRKFKDIKTLADPVELARKYVASGADELVFYDIGASVEGRRLFIDLLQDVRKEVTCPLIAGGGIKTIEDCEAVFEAGADKLSINTGAIEDPSFITKASEKYGKEKIILSCDIKNVDGTYRLFTSAGQKDTGLDAVEWIADLAKRGAGAVVVNSIDADGVQEGFDIGLLNTIMKRVDIPIIASGGAGSIKDFIELFRKLPRIYAGLAASVFHFDQVDIKELKEQLSEAGIPVNGVNMSLNIDDISFDEKGLIPAIVVEYDTGKVLMLAYMNKESLKISLDEKRTCFWSRSRNELWRKGESSGNVQHIKSIVADCDRDALLVYVSKDGPACHLGTETCFEYPLYGDVPCRFTAAELYKLLEARKENMPSGSYTTYLFKEGRDKILKKIGEETAEVIIAGKNADKAESIYEISDLCYHVLVMMAEMGINPEDIKRELESRHLIDSKLKQKKSV